MAVRRLPSGFELDDDVTRVDVAAVHRFLSEESYWARGRPLEVQEDYVRAATRVVGVYDGRRQIGFCRAVTAVGLGFVYLADVYVLSEYRGRGLGEELVREMVEQGPYADRRWFLHTEDMHALYRKLGFEGPNDRAMERAARPTT